MLLMKFVRNVSIQLKPAKAQDFSKMVTTDLLPLLKKQPGFTHELTMVRDNKVVAISVWNDKASADKYIQTTYPTVLEKLNPFIDGQPVIETYELAATSL
jgi:quinol monooxygenase YgiN